jgi:hypothetical protein
MTIYWLLMALLVALNVADYLTTKKGLRLGAREANPAMRWVIDKAGVEGLAVLKLAFIALLIYHSIPTKVLIILIVLYGAVVGNNLYQIRKIEK